MASTYSTSLKIQLIGAGEQSGTWNNTTNTNWNLIEQAVAGVQAITMINADYTLTDLNGVSDEARNAVLVVSGTNSAVRKIIAPLVTKTYVVYNNTSGGYAITIGGSSGTVATIPNGTSTIVYCDGVNFYAGLTGTAGNFSVAGNETVGGNSTVTGNLSVGGTTTLTGNATAPTQSAGDNSTKVATTAFVSTALAAAAITGTINMWPTASAPTGYLLCNGQAVSRSSYAALFAVLGTTFGTGDGSTTFNLPDYRDRMPIGAGTTYSANSQGGSKDAIVVSHTHTASVTDAGHTHNMGPFGAWRGADGTGNKGVPTWSSGDSYDYTLAASAANTNSSTTGISVSNSTTGSSGTNANLPPYLGIYFIIKT